MVAYLRLCELCHHLPRTMSLSLLSTNHYSAYNLFLRLNNKLSALYPELTSVFLGSLNPELYFMVSVWHVGGGTFSSHNSMFWISLLSEINVQINSVFLRPRLLHRLFGCVKLVICARGQNIEIGRTDCSKF